MQKSLKYQRNAFGELKLPEKKPPFYFQATHLDQRSKWPEESQIYTGTFHLPSNMAGNVVDGFQSDKVHFKGYILL